MPSQKCVRCEKRSYTSSFINHKNGKIFKCCPTCRKSVVKPEKQRIKPETLESKPDCLIYGKCLANAAYLNLSRDKMGCFQCDKYQPSPDVRITEMPTGAAMQGAFCGWAKNKMGARL